MGKTSKPVKKETSEQPGILRGQDALAIASKMKLMRTGDAMIKGNLSAICHNHETPKVCFKAAPAPSLY